MQSKANQGAGWRAAIPAQAVGKINIRLVPDQDPDEIATLVAAHLTRATAPLRTEIRVQSTASPALLDVSSSAATAASDAAARAFGRRPVVLRSGGTIPAVRILQQALQVDPVLLGFALPSDAMHAPNERFALENLWRGIDTCIHLLDGLGGRLGRSPGGRDRWGRSGASSVNGSVP